MISLLIKNEIPIISESLKSLLAKAKDIVVESNLFSLPNFDAKGKLIQPNIILFIAHASSTEETLQIKNLCRNFERSRILVLSFSVDESFILQAIKAGAKGILTKDTTANELIEAIYTLRSGYDYYGKSIAQILLNSYLKKANQNDNEAFNKQLKSLSEREMEVLKLFAESYTNQEIADKLFISIRTVESHKNNIMRKINLRTTVDLVKFAIRNNLIKI
ncbi:MAG: response regulator transcription factor [Bacteroidales bacterium]|nr:response regulator transcription factor [Bacteroidales bacterium]